MIKFIKSEELKRLHDRLKSLEADKKTLLLAKENLEAENLRLHNKIVEHVRNSAAMQKEYLKEIEKLTRKRNSKGQYIGGGMKSVGLRCSNLSKYNNV